MSALLATDGGRHVALADAPGFEAWRAWRASRRRPVIPRLLGCHRYMHEESDEGQPGGPAGPRDDPTIRVVIVDDYPYFRFGLRELLNSEVDIEVVAECADGQEAVDLAGYLVPDVVVTDLKMPRLDGAETTERLLRIDPDLAVVVVTSAPHGRTAARATAAGARAVLAKDVSPATLVAAVRTAYANASGRRHGRGERSGAPSRRGVRRAAPPV